MLAPANQSVEGKKQQITLTRSIKQVINRLTVRSDHWMRSDVDSRSGILAEQDSF
jgi:hypothetical protein